MTLIKFMYIYLLRSSNEFNTVDKLYGPDLLSKTAVCKINTISFCEIFTISCLHSFFLFIYIDSYFFRWLLFNFKHFVMIPLLKGLLLSTNSLHVLFETQWRCFLRSNESSKLHTNQSWTNNTIYRVFYLYNEKLNTSL